MKIFVLQAADWNTLSYSQADQSSCISQAEIVDEVGYLNGMHYNGRFNGLISQIVDRIYIRLVSNTARFHMLRPILKE